MEFRYKCFAIPLANPFTCSAAVTVPHYLQPWKWMRWHGVLAFRHPVQLSQERGDCNRFRRVYNSLFGAEWGPKSILIPMELSHLPGYLIPLLGAPPARWLSTHTCVCGRTRHAQHLDAWDFIHTPNMICIRQITTSAENCVSAKCLWS